MHTRGFGPGRTSAGPGRIGDVVGGMAVLRGLERACYSFMEASCVYYVTLWICEPICRREVPAAWLVLHIGSLPPF